MRVFVTGATGFIGSAVVRELLEAGHKVVGLARSDASAASLRKAGVEVHRGDLEDLDSLRSGADAADGVIHTAFNNNFSDYQGVADADRLAVETLGEALAGSGRPLVVTSVTTLLTQGRIGTEDEPPDPSSPSVVRMGSEVAAVSMAEQGVRTAAVRLPPSVHGERDHGFVPTLIDVARNKGVSAYLGDGSNRWPAVHRLDVAHLYRLALENAAAGTRVHAVADEGIPFRDIAEVIGQNLGVNVEAMSSDEAADHFGWLAMFVPIDNPMSNSLTQERLGWCPREAGLLADMSESGYFS